MKVLSLAALRDQPGRPGDARRQRRRKELLVDGDPDDIQPQLERDGARPGRREAL